MIEEVMAFRDASGKLHTDKIEALEADAVVALMKLEVFNHASAMALVKHVHAVDAVLHALAEAVPAVPGTKVNPS